MNVIKSTWRVLDANMRRQGLLLASLMLFSSIVEAAGIGLIFPLFSVIGNPDTVRENFLLSQVHTAFGQPKHITFVIIICATIFIFFILKTAVVLTIVYFRNRYVFRNQVLIENRLLESYLIRPFAFHLEKNSADLVRNITRSVGQFFAGTLMPILIILAELFVVVAIVIVLFVTEPLAALTIGLILTVPMVIFTRFLRDYLRRWGEDSHYLASKILTIISHSLGGIKEIKILGRSASFLDAHFSNGRAFAIAAEKLSIAQETPRFATELLAVGALLMVSVVALSSGRPTEEVLPVLGVFGAAAFRLMPSVNRLSTQINAVAFNGAAFKQIETDFDIYLNFHNCKKESTVDFSFENDFALKDISYRYENKRDDAISSISVTIKKGQSVAFVGPSGGGKSTLMNVILGLLRPTSGEICFDGQDVTNQLDKLRGEIGFVPQDVYLIDDTLLRNIAFGLNDADININRVKNAVQMAQLDSFVSESKDGLETNVGERGEWLSGGQRQRIAIARALYEDPQILVLDEATSSLDAETEAAITNAVASLYGKKTLIIVAHRLSTVKDCDKIYWMKDGRVSDSGSFSELAASNSEFRAMVDHLDLSGAIMPHGGKAAG
jgi:ATP-binding cassette, subfamily B, bacterial PglK